MKGHFSKQFTILLILLFVSACVSAPHIQVPDVNAKPVSVYNMSCKSPFKLTQDCSNFSGPTKSISIDGLKFKISGNESGTITRMYASIYGAHSENNNRAYALMKKELLNHDIEIVSVIPVLNQNKIQGYVISTKQPSYQIWDKFSTKKK